MFAFTKKQIVILQRAIETHYEYAAGHRRITRYRGNIPDDVWFAYCADRYFREFQGNLSNFLETGGDAWLEASDVSHKLCLRNLQRYELSTQRNGQKAN